METVDKETGVITDDGEAEADAAENEHEREGASLASRYDRDEPDDDEPDTASEKRGSDAAAEPMTAKQLEAIGRKIDAASTTHENALRRILGADFDAWMPCPLCMTDGHISPMPYEDRDPAQVDAVMAALGMGGPEMLALDDRYVECEGCHGFGQRRTPSKRAEHQVVNCDDCASRGYHEKRATPVAVANAWQPPPPVLIPHNEPGIGYNPPDPWGRPDGHRDYGVPPAQVGAA